MTARIERDDAADADRYRFLRDWIGLTVRDVFGPASVRGTGILDAAIDEAIELEKAKGKMTSGRP